MLFSAFVPVIVSFAKMSTKCDDMAYYCMHKDECKTITKSPDQLALCDIVSPTNRPLLGGAGSAADCPTAPPGAMGVYAENYHAQMKQLKVWEDWTNPFFVQQYQQIMLFWAELLQQWSLNGNPFDAIWGCEFKAGDRNCVLDCASGTLCCSKTRSDVDAGKVMESVGWFTSSLLASVLIIMYVAAGGEEGVDPAVQVSIDLWKKFAESTNAAGVEKIKEQAHDCNIPGGTSYRGEHDWTPPTPEFEKYFANTFMAGNEVGGLPAVLANDIKLPVTCPDMCLAQCAGFGGTYLW